MTAIVALTDTRTVVMAGDSAGIVRTGEVQLRKEPKVFIRDGYTIGFTTSFRMGQILRYESTLPTPPPAGNLHAFMVQEFVPAVREAFGAHGFTKTYTERAEVGTRGYEESGQEVGGRFLVGVGGSIFVIDGDFHVGHPSLPYIAIGSGSQVAHGALFALPETMPLAERATRALEASVEHTSGVRPPFTVIEL